MSISGLNPFRLTKLYSDTKASADNVVNTETSKAGDDPDLQALHRRLRIQKERLVTWGLEWSDESKSLAGAGIDESFARTGLSENVGNILRTIAECLDEATRLDEGSSMKTAKHSEVSKMVGTWPTTAEPRKELSPADRKRYEELCKDLTTSIDILYDLSRARKAFQQGTYPQSVPSLNPTNAITPEKTTLPPPLSKAVWSTSEFWHIATRDTEPVNLANALQDHSAHLAKLSLLQRGHRQRRRLRWLICRQESTQLTWYCLRNHRLHMDRPGTTLRV